MSESTTRKHFDHRSASESQNTSCTVAESPQETQTTESQLPSPAHCENSTNMGQCLSGDRRRKTSVGRQEAQPDCTPLNPRHELETAGTSQDTTKLIADEGQSEREKGGIRVLIPNVEYARSLQKMFLAGSEEVSGDTLYKTNETRFHSDETGHGKEEGSQRKEETFQKGPERGVNSILQSDEQIHMQETKEEILLSGKPASKYQEPGQTGGKGHEGNVQQASFVVVDTAKIDEDASFVKGTTQTGHKSISFSEIRRTLPLPHVQKDPLATSDLRKHVAMQEVELSVDDVLDFESGAIFTTEEILSPQSLKTAEEEGPQHVRNFYGNEQDCLESASRRKLYAGKALHKLLRNHPSHLAVPTYVQVTRDELVDVDTLHPNTIDGPPLCLLTDVKIRNIDRLMRMIPKLRTLRLPRIPSRKDLNLEDFFSSVAQQSGSLREMVFEDNGVISMTTANLLFKDDNSEDDKPEESSCFQRFEVYAPGLPILRALATNRCSPKELCFHALTPNFQRDLCQVLHKHGSSLRSLCLGFNLLVQEEPATGMQRRFWNGMISFLDVTVPRALSQLRTLEISSSPLYKVKHRFNTTFSEGSVSPTEGALLFITSTMEEKSRTRHPKEAEISLGDFRLAGGEELVVDALKGISWVNQDRMGVLIEIPGACAAFQRGYGKVNPVVLQSLQLDQFFFDRAGSEWLGFTCLKEIDIGEREFVKIYNTGGESMRKEARKLLVTSRDSLSKVRAYYEMPDRADVMNTGAILDEISTLSPAVTHLEFSRDIVMHANVADKEYVDMMMMLRRWDLKTMHLQSARNYSTAGEDNKPHKQDLAESAFTRFLKGLPAFLTIVATACPTLENLVLEWEDLDTEVNIMETRYLIRNVLSALDVYETTVPTVNVVTVRSLIQWYSICVNEMTKGAGRR